MCVLGNIHAQETVICHNLYHSDASDYRVSPWVLLSNNKPGSVTLNLAPEVELSDEDSPREDFHLDLIEESGILPRNVFFRGADVVIIDRIDK